MRDQGPAKAGDPKAAPAPVREVSNPGRPPSLGRRRYSGTLYSGTRYSAAIRVVTSARSSITGSGRVGSSIIGRPIEA